MITDIIKELGTVAGSITTIIAFVTILIKPVRSKLMCYIKKELGYNETNNKIEQLNTDVKKIYEMNYSQDRRFDDYMLLQKTRNELYDEAQLYNLR